MKWAAVIVGCISLFVLFFLALVFLGRESFVIAGAFLTGWWNYLSDVLPRVRWNAESWVTGGLFLLLGGWGLHRLLIWWHFKRGNPAWRIRQTCLGLALGFVVCATALASAGILHHGIWLMHSKEPLISYGYGFKLQKLAILKQVGLALRLWEEDHEGGLPETLVELYPDYMPAKALLYEGNLKKDIMIPWIYFGAGQKNFPADAVLLASSLDSDGKRFVIYGDQAGERVTEAQYQENRARFPQFHSP